MGKPLSTEHRLHISQSLKGKPRSAETKLKIRKAMKGIPLPADRKAKLVERILTMNHARKGIPCSPGRKLHISQARKGAVFSLEHRLHISESLKGKTQTTEHKLHVREALKDRPRSDKAINALKKTQQARIGMKHSSVSKLKMSKAKKGRILPIEHRSKMLATLRSPSHRQKMSRITKNSWAKPELLEKISGKNNSMWLGGKSFEPYSPEFNKRVKRLIRDRDNKHCHLCEGIHLLHIHHIDYNKLNSDPHNLITLCVSCHAKTGTRRDYWIAYFQTIMNSEEMLKANSLLPCYKLLVTPN